MVSPVSKFAKSPSNGGVFEAGKLFRKYTLKNQTCETKFEYGSKSPDANSSCYIMILRTCS